MSLDLYQKDLLRAASDASHAGRLENPQGTATVNNPLCGDKITIDVKLSSEGALDEYAHETEACVLCQASAGLIGSTLLGRHNDDCASTETALHALLEGTAQSAFPDGTNGFEIFVAVKDHTARHACVLMPFEALNKAIKEAQDK